MARRPSGASGKRPGRPDAGCRTPSHPGGGSGGIRTPRAASSRSARESPRLLRELHEESVERVAHATVRVALRTVAEVDRPREGPGDEDVAGRIHRNAGARIVRL